MSTEIQKAIKHLSQHDPVLAKIIATAPPAEFAAHQNYYSTLVGEIIGQQLSVKAAAAIRKRFEALFDDAMPTPEQILEKSVEELRAAGLSNAKGKYIRDLAQHVLDGKLQFEKLDSLSNDEVIAELTDVKGIGEWTAHMFMMFCMGRLDVLATGDLGIRNGVRALYGFKDAPTPDDVRAIAEKNHWHPYESVACWYVWQSLDNKPA